MKPRTESRKSTWTHWRGICYYRTSVGQHAALPSKPKQRAYAWSAARWANGDWWRSNLNQCGRSTLSPKLFVTRSGEARHALTGLAGLWRDFGPGLEASRAPAAAWAPTDLTWKSLTCGDDRRSGTGTRSRLIPRLKPGPLAAMAN